jgi:hypothetical protein
MSVYNPTGSGSVHIDRVISGGRKPVAAGMGFKAAASSVAKKKGIPVKQANKIIAAGARKASPAAKKANPNLMKVSGVKKAAKKMADPPKVNRERVAKPAPVKGAAGGAMCAEPKKMAMPPQLAKAVAAKKAPAKAAKAAPTSARQRRTAKYAEARTSASSMVRKTSTKKLPSQARIGSGQPSVGRGTPSTSGSGMY